MGKFVRVRNKKLGREYTTALVTEDERVLKDAPAVDRNGRPLPGKNIEKASGGGDDLESLTVAELRSRAEENNVDLAGATRKDEIITALTNSSKAE